MPDLQNQASFDEMLDALASVQRRTLLVGLLADTPRSASPVVSGDETKRNDFSHTMQMTHIHLPKLADYEFIEWNRKSDDVTKGPAFEEIRPLLKLLDTHRDELPEDWL